MRTEIVYEDADLLAVWKPAGFASQTARVGQADVVSELKNYLARTTGKSQPYLGVIHRLDQPVEGLLVFAKNKRAAAALTRQIGGGEDSNLMNKRYYAVFCGKPLREEGALVDYLRKGADGRAETTDFFPAGENISAGEALAGETNAAGKTLPASEVRAGEKISAKPDGFRKAVLHYRILQTVKHPLGEEISLADIRIDTGRFHQIRAQMAKAGMPLLGDLKYGSEASKSCGEKLGVRTVALCAYRIDLAHPVTGKNMSFERKPGTGAFSFFQL